MTYNVIITGTRSFDNYELLVKKCDYYLSTFSGDGDSDSDSDSDYDVNIITGDDGTAEMMAQRYAEENNYPVTVYHLDTEKYTGKAGKIRNADMVNDSDYAICFWNGKSGGVKSTINFCKQKGIPCKIIVYTLDK